MFLKSLVSKVVPSSAMCLFSDSSASILKVGDFLKQQREFSEIDNHGYLDVLHNYTASHHNSERAKLFGFEHQIVHPMLIASLFPRIIASHFPGAIYVSQSLHFGLPVCVGEEVHTEVKALNIKEHKNRYITKFLTKCYKNEEQLFIHGEASAILPTLAVDEEEEQYRSISSEQKLSETTLPEHSCKIPSSSSLLVSSSTSHFPKVNDIFKQARKFSELDVLNYSKLSQDFNILHLDSEKAREFGFDDRIVHGMLVASLFSQIITSHFPGAVYTSQSLKFKLPVYIGEDVTAEVQAVDVGESKNRCIKFSTKCYKDRGKLVIDGEAVALFPIQMIDEKDG